MKLNSEALLMVSAFVAFLFEKAEANFRVHPNAVLGLTVATAKLLQPRSAVAAAAEEENEEGHLLLRRHHHDLGREASSSTTGADGAIMAERRLTTTINPFDIVFIVDESGSMDIMQKALRANIPALFAALHAQAPGSRAGLIGYGGIDFDGHPQIPHLHIELTTDQYAFLTAANNLVTSGGIEPGYESIIEAVNAGGTITMGFQQGRGFCVVIFTDEQSNGDCVGCTQAAAIDALKNTPTINEANAKGVFFGVVSSGGYNGNTTASYGPIASATHGAMLSLITFVTNTNDVLNALVQGCSIAINQITLTPPTATLPLGTSHTLTIKTNQLSGGIVTPQGSIPLTLTVLSGGPPFSGTGTVTGTSDAAGQLQVLYNPLAFNPTFTGGTVQFQACRTDESPPACVTAQATFTNPCNGMVCPSPAQCKKQGSCVLNANGQAQCIYPNAPEDSPCNADNDACTVGDKCKNGLCQAGTQTVCTALDQCHIAGTCDPFTGDCSDPIVPENTACNDNDACTVGDKCENGVCKKGPAKQCTALDQCHIAGICNPTDGTCSNPNEPDNTPCDDRDPCTEPDQCKNGVCEGTIVDPDNDGIWGSCDNCPNVSNPSQKNSDNVTETDKTGDACDTDVCFDAENFGGLDALCAHNCGAGKEGEINCKQVCDYFGIEYKSPKQCRNAGALKNRDGVTVVGNNVCKANNPAYKRWLCCKCDKFIS